ncbi:hypothetical protein CBOM_07398 [Ceraceosorus bombacis]|uniref:Uncharacterized protein n=1 Tax=Ceraceosorus bombacis TaxID=401625 RepID=A0A0P1BB58_9BASI|nr:hypothetical protein CBOM_07398 [Ceraceosorus bombacis]
MPPPIPCRDPMVLAADAPLVHLAFLNLHLHFHPPGLVLRLDRDLEAFYSVLERRGGMDGSSPLSTTSLYCNMPQIHLPIVAGLLPHNTKQCKRFCPLLNFLVREAIGERDGGVLICKP